MNKKNIFLTSFVILLAVVYVVFFTDWFRPQTVGVFHTMRYVPRRAAARGAVMPELMFGLSQRLKLTEITLLSVDAAGTNQSNLPLWHLVTSSNSVPVKAFFYGQNIRGLRPAVSGSRPQLLTTNVTYRLIIQAGKIKGQHDFQLK